MSTATARIAAQQFERWINYDRGPSDPVSEERYYRLAMMHAAIAQAEAAERQAAALERANELADPYKLAEQIQAKDAEIARLKAELADYELQPPVITGMSSFGGGFVVDFEPGNDGREFHMLRRDGGSTCFYYTRGNSNHFILYDTADEGKK